MLACFLLRTAHGNPNDTQLPKYITDSWDVSRGYPGGQIYGVTQTSDGYLWIGTDRGLIRFDGVAFQVFRHVLPAKAEIDSVFALAGDPQGNLLISTAEGLQRLRLLNEELAELPRIPGQPEEPLGGIYKEKDGTILVATVRRGLVAYDGKSFTVLRDGRADITAVTRARDGTLWTGTATRGLFTYSHRQILNQPNDLRNARIYALLPFGDHGLSVGTDRGLLQWDGTNQPNRPVGPTHIRVMLEDREGHVWIGSSHGLFRLTSGDGSQSILPYSSSTVTSLYEDREGNVWVGTSTGIERLRKGIFTTYPLDSQNNGNGGPLVADVQGTIWCATSKLGLLRIRQGSVERVLGTGDFTSLAVDGPDLWLGRKDGALLRASGARGGMVSSRKKVQFRQPVTAIFKSREGHLWAGMQNGGVAEVADDRTITYANADGLVLNTVTAIEQDRDGVLWFATANGLAARHAGRWKSYTSRDGMPPGRINCILADRSGVVWAGADQGLAIIDKGAVHVLESKPSVLDEPILGIAADDNNFLWIMTSSHLVRVKRAELLRGDTASIFAQQFGTGDGLPPVLPSRSSRSIATGPEGRIWMLFGTVLVMADSVGLNQPSPPTLVQFQQIAADELLLRLGETVSIPAGHVRTVIRFAGLNFAAPERVRFRYKLQGLDHDWSKPTSAREASYTNLDPGPYRFQVQATNTDGLWNGQPAEIGIYLEPSLWQTLWFRSLAALAVFAMGFAAYRLRLRAFQRQWKLRFQERLDERTRIARDLHDTLLQSFQGLILRFQAVKDMLPENPHAASDAMNSAIDRAAEAITEGRDAVQALRGEDESDELEESLAAIDREFRYELKSAPIEANYRVLVEGTSRPLHPLVRDDLHRIAREALRNAFRHAQAKSIEVDIRYDDTVFRLRVRDDGAGIDPQVLNNGRRKGHYGLPGMRERAISIGGQLEIWSELERGTEIEITIPGMIAYARFENSGQTDLY